MKGFVTKLKQIKNYRGKGKSLIYHLKLDSKGMFKRLTIKRALNIIHVIYEWKIGKSTAKSRPFVVRIETSSVCNLQCPSCTTPKRTSRVGQNKIMSLKAFKKIFESISNNTFKLTYYIQGEPMMNPRLFDMVKIANEENIFTYYCTNFTLMKKSLLKPLFDSGLDKISVCLDGFSQASYEKYRVKGNVDRVKEGIIMLMKYKKEHGYGYPFLNVFTITFNHVKPEIEKIKSFCSENEVDQLTLRPDESNFDGLHYNVIPKKSYSKCFWPWMGISIDVDGSVYPCDQSRYAGFSFGNLIEQDLDEIWNSQFYVETRKFISGKKRRSEGLKIPCYACKKFE